MLGRLCAHRPSQFFVRMSARPRGHQWGRMRSGPRSLGDRERLRFYTFSALNNVNNLREQHLYNRQSCSRVGWWKGINLMSIKFGACSAFAAALFSFALTTMPAHAYVEAGMVNFPHSRAARVIC